MAHLFLKNIAEIFETPCPKNCLTNGAAVDSRLIQPGQLFFALKGVKSDGHDYLAQVASSSVEAAVVSKEYRGPDFGLTLLRVADPLLALQKLAREQIEHRAIQIIGVTGTVGKTTSKEFIADFLSLKWKVARSPGNSNTQTSLPLNILNILQEEDEVLVLEMGMTEKGNIQRLVEIAPPNIALVTNISLVHAINFNSLEEIAAAKAEIFSNPSTTLGIYPSHVTGSQILRECGTCAKRSFSLEDLKADFNADLLKKLPKLKIVGEHQQHNLLAAVAIALSMGMRVEEIAEVVPKLKLPENRWVESVRNGIHFINDSYNASPLAVHAALKSMPKPLYPGRKIAVFGDMLELGSFSKQAHEELATFASPYVDQLFLLGHEMETTYLASKKPAFWTLSMEELAAELKKILQPEDVVLIKGSRSLQMWKVLDLL